jgi:DNA-binding protein HU-beta
MIKDDLVQRLSKKADIPQTKALAAIDALMEIVADELASGGEIILRGFGTFKTVERAEKTARDIGKGKAVIIPAHKAVKFVVGKELKEKVK